MPYTFYPLRRNGVPEWWTWKSKTDVLASDPASASSLWDLSAYQECIWLCGVASTLREEAVITQLFQRLSGKVLSNTENPLIQSGMGDSLFFMYLCSSLHKPWTEVCYVLRGMLYIKLPQIQNLHLRITVLETSFKNIWHNISASYKAVETHDYSFYLFFI